MNGYPLPPRKEQRRIVAAIDSNLSRVDAGVAGFKLARAKLKRYRAAVLKAACEGRLVPTEAELARDEDRNYEPANRLLASILKRRRESWEEDQFAKMVAEEKLPKDGKWKAKYQEPPMPRPAELADLPEVWTWASLEQVAWEAGYGTSEKCDYDGDGPPVLRIPNISKDRIDLTDIKLAIGHTKINSREFLAPDDLLVVRTNGSKDLIGRGAVVRDTLPRPHHYASYLIRFRLVAESGLGDWLSTIWHSPAIRESVERVAATSAGQYNVSLSTLNSLMIPIPPRDEQARIVAEVERRLSLIDELEAAISTNLKRADRLRQSILKRAFEGKLVPQDPDDEPAAVLLERIRLGRNGTSPLLPGL